MEEEGGKAVGGVLALRLRRPPSCFHPPLKERAVTHQALC